MTVFKLNSIAYKYKQNTDFICPVHSLWTVNITITQV